MQHPSHSELEELFKEIILPFYHIRRYIPVPSGDRHMENDAEHSWSLAFLACALAPRIDASLDVGLIAQFATVHDIVEVYAGDTTNFDDEHTKTKAAREAQALQTITSRFSHFPWILTTLQRYELRDTDEAKFVYSLDKYIPTLFDYLDGGQYLRDEKITREQYIRQLSEHRKKAQAHPIIGKYYDEIRALIEANPEQFYIDSLS